MSEKEIQLPGRPGARLQAALTQEQIRTLLDVLAEAGHLRAVESQLRSADPDLADMVRRVLDKPAVESERAASAQKTLEIWNELWVTWAGHVEDVADEKGPYANHKEHWHPPFFDHGALDKDLEAAAGPLSEWLERASPLVKEPDLFLESLAELNRNMRLLPEWFQPVEDNFVLGPRATTCVLRWTWLGLAQQPEPGRRLVDLLSGLEVPGKHSEMDRDACCQFLAELPEAVCREIHAYLREPQFVDRLADLRSVWHRIQHGFEGRFDPAAHLRACEEHLEQDWRYGRALIADALWHQDFAAAEKYIERTLSSLLGWSEEEPWRPEKLLLPESRHYRPPEEEQAKFELLDQWEETASRLRKQERVASLRFQRAVLQSQEDWTAVLDAFREYQRHLTRPSAAERLFAEWQHRMAAACTQHEQSDKRATDTWMHRLLEAQRHPATGQEAFLEYLDVWLERCREHVASFQKNWRTLDLLTRHLPKHPELRAACPTFHSHVLVPALQVSEEMEKSLRHALGLLGEKAKRIERPRLGNTPSHLGPHPRRQRLVLPGVRSLDAGTFGGESNCLCKTPGPVENRV